MPLRDVGWDHLSRPFGFRVLVNGFAGRLRHSLGTMIPSYGVTCRSGLC
jgi:hypothetical protein